MTMIFAEKLKSIRKQAGMSQEQLAETLGVSMDYLMDDGSNLDFSETKKPIDLTKYGDGKKLSRGKKAEIKERIIREEYPDAEIMGLTVAGFKNSKAETIADEAIGWFALILGGIPLFGTQEFGKMANSFDQQYYLVNEEKAQYFVLLTDEHLISRTITDRITDKKFEIGDRKFLAVGKVQNK
jgi:hypothetical protein